MFNPLPLRADKDAQGSRVYELESQVDAVKSENSALAVASRTIRLCLEDRLVDVRPLNMNAMRCLALCLSSRMRLKIRKMSQVSSLSPSGCRRRAKLCSRSMPNLRARALVSFCWRLKFSASYSFSSGILSAKREKASFVCSI